MYNIPVSLASNTISFDSSVRSATPSPDVTLDILNGIESNDVLEADIYVSIIRDNQSVYCLVSFTY